MSKFHLNKGYIRRVVCRVREIQFGEDIHARVCRLRNFYGLNAWFQVAETGASRSYKEMLLVAIRRLIEIAYGSRQSARLRVYLGWQTSPLAKPSERPP